VNRSYVDSVAGKVRAMVRQKAQAAERIKNERRQSEERVRREREVLQVCVCVCVLCERVWLAIMMNGDNDRDNNK